MDEYENEPQDKSNAAVQTMSGMAIISAILGIILLIAGAQASNLAPIPFT